MIGVKSIESEERLSRLHRPLKQNRANILKNLNPVVFLREALISHQSIKFMQNRQFVGYSEYFVTNLQNKYQSPPGALDWAGIVERTVRLFFFISRRDFCYPNLPILYFCACIANREFHLIS